MVEQGGQGGQVGQAPQDRGLVSQVGPLKIDWPRPEGELAIIGNPPYLGVRKLRRELGDEYVEELFSRFPANRAAD